MKLFTTKNSGNGYKVALLLSMLGRPDRLEPPDSV